jgi:WD40 repeat protein
MHIVVFSYSQELTIDSLPLKTLTAASSGSISVCFSPNNKLLAAGNMDHSIMIWDTDQWKIKRKLTGHHFEVNGISFSPDSKIIASCSYDKTIKLWDIATGKLLKTLLLPDQGWGYDLKFINDSTIISGSSTGHVLLINIHKGTIKKIYDTNGATVHSIAYSAKYKSLYFSGPFMILNSMDFSRKARINGISGLGSIDAFEGATEMIASTNHDGMSYFVKDVTNPIIATIQIGRPLIKRDRISDKLITINENYPNASIKFSPNGKYLTIAGYIPIISIWDIETQKVIVEKKGHTKAIIALAYSVDKKYLASASLDGTIKIWKAPM